VPEVTVKHTFMLPEFKGGRKLLLVADVRVADGEYLNDEDFNLKTLLDVKLNSKDPNINMAVATIYNAGSFGASSAYVVGSDVSGSVAVAAGSTDCLAIVIGQ